MGALERKDIITEEGIMAPLILTKNLEEILKVQDKIIANGKAFSDSFKGNNGGGTEDVKKKIGELSEEQKQLATIQQQINREVAKGTDNYRAYAIQLQKVKDENKANAATNDSWTKSVNAQNASLTELEKALNKNRIAYSALRNEQERNGKTGKDLLGVIQKQAKEVDVLRTSMGQAQQRVGGYKEAIENAIPAMRKLNPELVEAGESVAGFGSKLLAVVSNPISAVLATVAAGFAIINLGIDKYKENTIEGADLATVFDEKWDAAFSAYNGRLREIGKDSISIFQTIKLRFAEVASIFGTVALGGDLNTAIAKIAANETLAEERGKILNELHKDEILLTTELAELENRKNKDLFDAREKIRKSDQDRYEALLDSRKAIQEEIALQLKENDLERSALAIKFQQKKVVLDIDTKSRDIISDSTKFQKIGYELVKELAEVETKRLQIQDRYNTGQRRTQGLLATLINETVDKRLEAEKTIIDANKAGDELIVKNKELAASKIIGNQAFSLEQQLAAEKDLYKAEAQLLSTETEKQREIVRQDAIKRVKLSSDTLDEIYKKSGGKLEKIVDLTIDAYNAQYTADVGYVAQTKALAEKEDAEQTELLKKRFNARAKIKIDNDKYFIDLNERFRKEDRQKETRALDEQFANNEITVTQYMRRKAKILGGGSTVELEQQKQYYEEQIVALKKYLAETENLSQENKDKILGIITSLESSLTDTTDKSIALRLKGKQREKELTQQLYTELGNALTTIGDNIFAGEEQRVQASIDLLNKQKDESIKAAGDNKNAQLQIERAYNEKIDIETKRLNALKRKQAIFDKRAAEFKIAIEIAKGVAQAFGEFPFPVAIGISALLAAIGAVQIATIESAPIPSYAVGTDDHPGGPAVVGEKGRELIHMPGGGFSLSPARATVVDLPVHSSVTPNDETMRLLALASLANGTVHERLPQGRNFEDARIVAGLDRIAGNLPDVLAHGNELFKVFKSRDGSRRKVRMQIFGY